MKAILFSMVIFLTLTIQAQNKLKVIQKSQKSGIFSPEPLNDWKIGIPNSPSLFDSENGYPAFGTMKKMLPGFKVLQYTFEGKPSWIEGRLPKSKPLTGQVEADAVSYLEYLKPLLGLLSETTWRIAETSKDDFGKTHISVLQYIDGIKVYNGEFKVHCDENGPYLCNGSFFAEQRTTCNSAEISTQSLFNSILTELVNEKRYHTLSAEELYLIPHADQVVEEKVWFLQTGTNQLAKVMHYTIYPNVAHRWEYFVDICKGTVLNKFESLCGAHGRPQLQKQNELLVDGPKTATALDLNNISRTLNTYQVGSTYYLEDASTIMFNPTQSQMPNDAVGAIITLDAGNKSPNASNFNYTLISSNNNSWSSKNAVSGHWNAQEAYKYFNTTHGRKGIDNNGGNIISLINVADDNGGGLDNAFWNGQAMFYGSGDQAFKPLAGGLDVGGHEMAHGVVGTTANLEYQGESGALNESYADIFGAMIDRNDWLIGEDVVKVSAFPSGALRSMSDPHNGGTSLNDPGYQPKILSEKYNGSEDNEGVHINSGIPNYAFFLFASNPAVGKDKAEKIYYKALVDYLVKSSKFIDARAAVVQAAKDIHGAGSPIVTAAENAFASVGIGGGGNAGGSNYQKDVSVNPGDDFIVATDENNSKLYIAYGANFSTIEVLADIPVNSKPSVTDDGSAVVFTSSDKKIYGVIIDWSTGQTNLITISNEAKWDNVAVSKDGFRIAAVPLQAINELWVFDFSLAQWNKFDLYNPTYTQGINTGDVEYADALEWDFSGNYVIYDAYNNLNGVNGTVNWWDIGFIRAFNKSNFTFGDGKIDKLFSGIPENVSIGNPSFSKNSPYVIAFDYIDEASGDIAVLGYNLETGANGTIVVQSEPGIPSFSRLDNEIVFNSVNDEISKIAIKSNKIEANGTDNVLFTGGRQAVWFSNGLRTINIATQEQNKSIGWKLLNTLAPDRLQLQNVGPKNQSLHFSIIDLNGRTLQTQQNEIPSNDSVIIQLDQLRSGLYILTGYDSEGSFSFKFVKP